MQVQKPGNRQDTPGDTTGELQAGAQQPADVISLKRQVDEGLGQANALVAQARERQRQAARVELCFQALTICRGLSEALRDARRVRAPPLIEGVLATATANASLNTVTDLLGSVRREGRHLLRGAEGRRAASDPTDGEMIARDITGAHYMKTAIHLSGSSSSMPSSPRTGGWTSPLPRWRGIQSCWRKMSSDASAEPGDRVVALTWQSHRTRLVMLRRQDRLGSGIRDRWRESGPYQPQFRD